MTVAELGERMSEREFQSWQLYEQLEPFGELREDYRAASICLTIYNCMRGRGSKDMTLDDFLVKFEPAVAEEEEEQEGDFLMAFAQMMGAKIVREDGDLS